MTQPALRDLLIFLPGIMGSTLRRGDTDLWALSGQTLWQAFRTVPKIGTSLLTLKGRDDNFEAQDLGDGIEAGEVIMGDVLVAPLVRIGGYRPIIERIQREFSRVTVGSVHTPRDDANFFPFPYDWRRDNRASALRLKAFVERQLPLWRKSSGVKDAKVILVAHSMGGLVSRYYLEVLGGWQDCRLLLTIATPHRGALNAIDTLANGIKYTSALTEVARELTSIYQLLPIYPAVTVKGEPTRVADTDSLTNIVQDRAKAAREDFHLAIIRHAQQNRKSGFSQLTIPWVGVHQDTYQSAFVEHGRVTMGYHLPPAVDIAFDGGDGTVPRVSAVPADFTKAEEDQLARYSAQQHGWITNNEMTLTPLLESLRTILSTGSQNVLGTLDSRKPAINLRANPVFGPGEPVEFGLSIAQATRPLTLEVRLIPTEQGVVPLKAEVRVEQDTRGTLRFEGVPPGLYRVSVRSRDMVGIPPESVQSLVEVVDLAAIDALSS